MWAEEFNKMQSDYSVTIRGGGSGVGINDVASGLSQIGMTSRQVKSSEIDKFGDKFIEHVIAKDCICIVVSKPIYDAGVKDLSQDQIKKIYMGEIDNWNEVGGPTEPIFCVAREVGSGTRDYFNEHFFADTKKETPGVDTYEGSNAGVATAVGNSDKAIGYVALNYINAKGLHAVAVDGVEPTMETARDGSYPIVRDLYMYTFNKTSDGAQAFLDFALSEDGQKIAEEEGFPPVQ
jgi:phosphate transport system substrate-binding protein